MYVYAKIVSRRSMSIVPNVIRSSPCRWGVLFPSEKLLIYVVDIVVNSFRFLFVYFPEYIRAPCLKARTIAQRVR